MLLSTETTSKAKVKKTSKKTLVFLPLLLIGLNNQLIAQEASHKQLDALEQRTSTVEKALKELSYLKISGYLQGQYQVGQEEASLRVGSNLSKTNTNSRIGMRRSRVKFSYDRGIASAVFQIDATERSVLLKDAYINIRSPWQSLGRSALRIGVFDRPFGHEISYSSSLRESPERSAIFNNLFPDERDLGAMIILQPKASSPLHFLRLEAGLFAGNAIQLESDDRLDFIGHLSTTNTVGKMISWGLGTSYYHGYRQINSTDVYKMGDGAFTLNVSNDNVGTYAPRRYWGVDAQIKIQNPLGTTQLRAEYLLGTQSSTANSFRSHNSSSPTSGDTYVRPFSGGYAILVHQLGKSPFSLVAKYDWLDPNTKLSKDALGLGHSTTADVAQETLGLGLLWSVDSNLRLQAYYEHTRNELSSNLSGYERDRKDEVFTLRIQYKF